MICSYLKKHQLQPKNFNDLSLLIAKINRNFTQYQPNPDHQLIIVLKQLIKQIIEQKYHDQQLIILMQTLLKVVNS